MPLNQTFELQPNGDTALDIRFEETPGENLSERIIALAETVESSSLTSVTELVPAYQSLTVCFDPLQLPQTHSGDPDTAALEQALKALTEKVLKDETPAVRERHVIRIPVCYDGEFAPDMPTLRAQSGLSEQEIIARHAAPRYLVHMLGFTPGFLYLGGLDKRLQCPRKTRPALRVPAGSVGIGGTQTGIYPQDTPGGWQIIGRTPLALFRPTQTPAFLARPLDYIQFVPISTEQFAAIAPLSAPEKIPLADAKVVEHGR